jgi:hypothetical protein
MKRISNMVSRDMYHEMIKYCFVKFLPVTDCTQIVVKRNLFIRCQIFVTGMKKIINILHARLKPSSTAIGIHASKLSSSTVTCLRRTQSLQYFCERNVLGIADVYDDISPNEI